MENTPHVDGNAKLKEDTQAETSRDTPRNSEENEDFEALRLAINSDEEREIQTLNDQALAVELQKSLDEEIELEKLVQERLDRLAALKLQEEQLEEDRIKYATDKALAHEHHYKQRPSYANVVSSEGIREIDSFQIESSTCNDEKDDCSFETEALARMTNEDIQNFVKDITVPFKSSFTIMEIRNLLDNENFTTGERQKIEILAARLTIYANNESLRKLLMEKRPLYMHEVPSVDLHGLRIKQANRILYKFLGLAKINRLLQICVYSGIGIHSKKGKPRITIMVDGALSKLASERNSKKRVVNSFEYKDGAFYIKLNKLYLDQS